LGKHFSLVASDSFKLGAYRADPSGTPKGGVVVIQEIFGVNHHIRAVCDRIAAQGYAALAPALFDRQQPNFESGYSPDEIAEARKFVANPDWAAMMRDVQAAIDEAKKSGPTAIVGFCLGGTIAFLAAAKLNGLSAAIGWYGGQIVKNADEKPKVPTQLHFGEKDASIPMSDVEIIKQKRGGDCEIYVYPDAQHGFNCEERGSYNEAAAKLARERSIAFLNKNLKK
jgi:carboxymethylenebutenolidase